MTSFFRVASSIGLVAVTLPVTAELLVLTAASLLPRRRRRQFAPTGRIALSVVIPAHNEELLVTRAIESVQASSGDARILVVAHNCSDRTAECAAEAGADVLIYNDPDARGKGFALRRGFEEAFAQGADAALVIDADSMVSKNLVGAVSSAFLDGWEAVQSRYEMSASVGAGRAHLAALALRGFNRIRPRGRDRLGLSCGILGNGFAVAKNVFSEIPYKALSVVEDLEYHIHLNMAGKRVRFLDEATVTAELPVTSSGETTQRSRWEGGRFHTALLWFWPLTKQVLRGQVRLIEPLLDLAGLPLAYACAALVAGTVLAVGPLRLYFVAAFGVVGFHVLVTAWEGDDFSRELRLLCRAPGYILWKLLLFPRLLRGAGARAAWVRTERATAVRRP